MATGNEKQPDMSGAGGSGIIAAPGYGGLVMGERWWQKYKDVLGEAPPAGTYVDSDDDADSDTYSESVNWGLGGGVFGEQLNNIVNMNSWFQRHKDMMPLGDQLPYATERKRFNDLRHKILTKDELAEAVNILNNDLKKLDRNN